MPDNDNALQDLVDLADEDFVQKLDQVVSVIDEQVKAHEELKDLLFGVIEFLPIAIWVFDEGGELFLQNSQAKGFEHLFQALQERHDKISSEIQKSFSFEFNERFYIINSTKVKNKLIISVTDNTDSKRQERLVSMGKMAAHLAHEIRNPVGAVSNFSSVLLKKVNTPLKPVVLEMKKAVYNIESIIKSTLLFSKGIVLNEKMFCLSAFDEVVKFCQDNTDYEKPIIFDHFAPKQPIYGDVDLLTMVIKNITLNAIEAIEESEVKTGFIQFEYQKSYNYQYISITDNGVDFANKKKLFEAFETTKVTGNGLGLALSKQIIEAHKGNIEVLNTKKGFKISLPILE